MNPEFSGEKVDLEVARYGLRTFRPIPPDGLTDHEWLMKVLLSEGPMPSIMNDDTVLGPVYITHRGSWVDGTCKAECVQRVNSIVWAWGKAGYTLNYDPLTEHTAPHEECHCGIYACHTLDHLQYQYPTYTQQVLAVVAAEGQTIMGSRGFRTQFARVVAYWCDKRLRTACARQFKDAALYTDIDEMLKAYDLRRHR